MKKKFYIECDCGSEILSFEKTKDEKYEEIWIQFYVSAFGERQRPIRTALKNRLKMIWCGITGKEYALMDMVIWKAEDLENFYQNMKEFVE